MKHIRLFFLAAVFSAVFSFSLRAADAPPPLPPLPTADSGFTELKLPANALSAPPPSLPAPSSVPLPSVATSASAPMTSDKGTSPLPVPPLPLELPPLPGENSLSLQNTENKPQEKEAVLPPAPVKEIQPEEKPRAKVRHKRIVRKESKPHFASQGSLYFRSERLPSTIYRKSYNGANHHLPMARYEQEYDALVFVTAERDDLNGLRAMLGTGRKVDMVNRAGDTPLLAAVKHNAINTARLLLALHANPNVQDGAGMTPLAIAATNGNYPMMRALEEMGARPVQVSSNP